MVFFLDRLLKYVEIEEKMNTNMTHPRNMIISWAYLENETPSTRRNVAPWLVQLQ